MDAGNLHNSLGTGVAQLRAYIHRIEDLEGEVAALNDGKREVYGEAKAAGFDKATIRKLVQRRRKSHDELQETDALLEAYEAALAEAGVDPLA